MNDPIEKPVPEDDKVYGNLGAPKYTRLPNAKELQAGAVKRQQERDRNALIETMESERGQIVLMNVLKFCGIYQTTQEDREAEGRRQVGLFLISKIIDADPEAYPKLLQQHLERQRSIAAEESAITENARREVGTGRKILTTARDFIRSTAKSVADRVF